MSDFGSYHNMVRTLVFAKHNRNLFYHRIGRVSILFSWILPGDNTLRLPFSCTIGSHCHFIHNDACHLNAESIGNDFVCYPHVVIGSKSLCDKGKPTIGNNDLNFKIMVLSTTPTIEGHTIREYKGVVTGETIIGANMFKDLFAGIRDIVGGRAGSYEKVLREAKDEAMREMMERAQMLGANAIVGIDLDYETIGANGSILMVAASGTAVVL